MEGGRARGFSRDVTSAAARQLDLSTIGVSHTIAGPARRSVNQDFGFENNTLRFVS